MSGKYTVKLANGTTLGTITTETEPLGTGGEGSVYPLTNITNTTLGTANSLVAKIYHPDEQKRPTREAKCQAMLASVPKTDSIIWNLGNLYTPDGKFAGYLMRRLHMDTYRTFMEVAHTRQRRQKFPNWSILHSLLMARNLAVAIDAVHTAGHIVGDINESNVLVANDATVRIIDADSAQITYNNQTYPCTVGKPEFTAPEISKGSYSDPKNRRTPATDAYAFTIMLFNALMGRAHPTQNTHDGPQKEVTELIQNNIYPTFTKLPPGYSKDPKLEYEAIPPTIHTLIKQGLNPNPHKRPTFNHIIKTFDTLLTTDHNGKYTNLHHCKNSNLHWWEKTPTTPTCPLCQYKTKHPNNDIWTHKEASKGLDNLAQALQKEAQKQTQKQAKHQQTPAPTPATYVPPVTTKTATHYQPPTHSTPTPTGNPNTRQPGQPPTPTKVNKRLAVNTQAGTQIPRPSLGTLLANGNIRIAFDALAAEHPNIIPWVSKYRAVPRWWAILAFNIILGVMYWLSAPHITDFALKSLFPEGAPEQAHAIAPYLTNTLWILPTSVLALRFISALILWYIRHRETKKHGYGSVEYEKVWKTALSNTIASLTTGLIIPFMMLVALIIAVVSFIIKEVASSSSANKG